MGSLKSIAVAGVVVFGVSAASHAADLPPPPVLDPAPVLRGTVDSGFYVRGDVGVGIYSSAKVSSAFQDATVAVPGFAIDQASIDGVAFAGIGLGYQFNNWLRFDGTAEFRTPSKVSAIESYTSAGCGGTRCYEMYSSTISSSVFLFNSYIDLGTWGGFTPFLGAGVGVANHKISGLYDLATNGGFGFAADKSATKFAWALMAGVGFDVTKNLKLEAGYRYLDMGQVGSAAIICQNTPVCPREVHKYDMKSHDIRVGFRYLFGAETSVAYAAPVGGYAYGAGGGAGYGARGAVYGAGGTIDGSADGAIVRTRTGRRVAAGGSAGYVEETVDGSADGAVVHTRKKKKGRKTASMEDPMVRRY